MKISEFISLTALSIFLFSVTQAKPAPNKSVRYARIHGTIEKSTVSDINSVKSSQIPKREKICDIDMKVPIDPSFDNHGMTSSSPCSTRLQGKPAKVFVMGRMYLDAKASTKGVDLILFVESPLFETSRSFAAGAYTPNLSLQSMSLWHSDF